MHIENKFFVLDEAAGRIQYWQQKLSAACEANDEKAAYEALHFIEKTLIFASGLKLSPAPDATPTDGAKYQQSHKYCACCGAWRGIAPLNCSTGIHDVLSIRKYKLMERGQGRIYETSPSLQVGASVYRNGGSSEDQYVCRDCLTMGLRYVRDRLNEILDESYCKPNHLTLPPGLIHQCVGCAGPLPPGMTGTCKRCDAESAAWHAAREQQETVQQ